MICSAGRSGAVRDMKPLTLRDKSRLPFWIACCVAMGIALIWLKSIATPDFPMDDAYIVQHVVESVRLGRDWRFGGSPLNGATSLAHVMAIWLFAFLMPIPWAQFVVAAVCYVLWVAGAVEMARRRGLRVAEQGMLAVLSASAGLVLNQAFNGLETGMAMAAVMWALVVFGDPKASRPWHGAMLGALPFIRPELSLLAVLILISTLQRQRPWWGTAPRLLSWVALAILPIAAFAWWAGGNIWPNTVSAKTYFFADACWPLSVRLNVLASEVWAFLSSLDMGWVGLGLLGLPLARLRGAMIGFVCVFLLAYFLRLPGALNHNFFRYQYVMLPLIMAGWVALLESRARWLRLPAISTMIVSCVICVALFNDGWAVLAGGVAFTRRELAGVSDWVVRRVPHNAVVLVHDAGYLSLQGQQRLVDVVGLKTPSSMAVHKQHTFMTCDRLSPALSLIAQHAGAQFFVVLVDWDRIFQLTNSLRAQGWHVARADGERGQTSYRVYEIRPPDSPPAAGEHGPAR